MDRKPTKVERDVYKAVSASLVDFGYPDCTPVMIQDAHETMLRGGTYKDAKHGVVSAFAIAELEKVIEMGIPIEEHSPNPIQKEGE